MRPTAHLCTHSQNFHAFFGNTVLRSTQNTGGSAIAPALLSQMLAVSLPRLHVVKLQMHRHNIENPHATETKKAVCLPRKSGMFTPHNFFKAIVAQHFSGTLFPNTIRTFSTNRCARPHFTGGRACYNILATTPLLTQTEGTPRHQAMVRKKTQNAREC